ncbi:hypothetical protein [Bradyrhizobium monzae]|uniref:hypothetical protein n=1 Tax=Bradyrhizobium sp. Oc8 TaxID=2876780 RepID=UPI001F24DFE3|nr:hypothetical protein [Bradyrhizobium sp. Oc8]
MTKTTGRRRLETPDDRADSRRWQLVSSFFLVGLVVLAIFTQKQLPDDPIRPTGPLPAVDIP